MTHEGKCYAVTGVSSGIGEAAAQALKHAGARVIGLDIRPCTTDCDIFLPLDQGDFASIDAAIAAIDDGLDGLCNIAGVPPSDRFTLSQILMINFYGLRRLTLGLAPKLKQGASIVNVASGAGGGWLGNLDLNRKFLRLETETEISAAIVENRLHNQGMDSAAVYPFSKELVIAWTLKHSKDWVDRRIRMNAVSPGATETPILDDFIENFGTIVSQRTQAFGFGKPEQIAAVILFLLTTKSAWINGANIPVDGGISAAVISQKLQL